MESQTRLSERHLVASFPSYEEAENAVDSLSKNGFPVDQLTIVADRLRLVENVTGRRGYTQQAVADAATGAAIGALLGFALGLFSLIDPVISGLALAFYGAVFGAAIGLVVGALSQGISAGRRDFSSIGSVEAGRCDVLADTAEHAEEAARKLASSPVTTNG